MRELQADTGQTIKKLVNNIRVREDVYHCIEELAALGVISELDLYDAFLLIRERTEIPLRVLQPMYQSAVDELNEYNFNWPDVSRNSAKPLSTYKNFKHLCELKNITLTENLMTHSCHAAIDGEAISEAELLDIIISAGLFGYHKTIKSVSRRLAGIGKAIHPVHAWLGDDEWDGVDRIEFLITKLNIQECTEKLARVYLTRWMLGAMDCVYNPRGVVKQSMLVLQGESGCGKTHFFESLLPQEFMPDWFGIAGRTPWDARNLRSNTKKWLLEFVNFQEYLVHGFATGGRRTGLSDVGAFLDRGSDSLGYHTTDRRMFFCAGITTKKVRMAYSADRHYFVIPIGTIKFNMEIDVHQLWLQIRSLYKDGQQHVLLKDEFKQHMRYASVISTRPHWTEEQLGKNTRWLKR